MKLSQKSLRQIIREEFQRFAIVEELEKKKRKISEELSVLEEGEVLEEGILTNIALTLGITLSSFANVLGQSIDLKKLQYDPNKKIELAQALENPNVIKKLEELGVEDNNIERAAEKLKGKKPIGYTTKTVTTETDLIKYLNKGYHLTRIEADTLVKMVQDTIPETIVEQHLIEYDDASFFASGSFKLSEQNINDLKVYLEFIQSDGGNVVNIIVKSSTDKQGLSQKLTSRLEKMGYSGDNQGLSQVRNDVVTKVLQGLGVDTNIINQNVFSSQGPNVAEDPGDTARSQYRFVKVYFDVLTQENVASEVVKQKEIKIPQTQYKMFKAIAGKKGPPKISPVKIKKCKYKIKKYNKEECSAFRK